MVRPRSPPPLPRPPLWIFRNLAPLCSASRGLSMALQVFTRVMAPVSAFLHRSSIRIRRYLDNWLPQASSRDLVLQALDSVLHLCRSLGIVINMVKSTLVPSQRIIYLGMQLDSLAFRASPSQPRVEKLLSIAEEFLSSVAQPASSWQVLLGVLCSLIPLVPGGRSSSVYTVAGIVRTSTLLFVGTPLATLIYSGG